MTDRPQDDEELERRFREYTDEVELPFVMCAPQMLDDDNWFFPHDGHPNEVGNRFVAATLREPVAKLLSDP